jgi:hypothetical protein
MRPAVWLLPILLGACSAPAPPARTVEDFMEEPAVMQGVIEACNADQQRAARDVECTNARMALERKAVAEDAQHKQERDAQSEKLREQVREREREAQRQAELNRKPGFDPYTSPVTVDTPPAPAKP